MANPPSHSPSAFFWSLLYAWLRWVGLVRLWRWITCEYNPHRPSHFKSLPAAPPNLLAKIVESLPWQHQLTTTLVAREWAYSCWDSITSLTLTTPAHSSLKHNLPTIVPELRPQPHRYWLLEQPETYGVREPARLIDFPPVVHHLKALALRCLEPLDDCL